MFKVVLVDDESLVKIGIKSLVNWNDEGFQIVGEGNDGESGLALIKEHNPDLVITDIVMPRMNGIDMMAKAKEISPDTVFVVLSSYDEFDLVKKAMKNGAYDYILKLNINSESMSEILTSVKDIITDNRRKMPAVPPIKSYDVQSTAIMRREFLKSILENSFNNRKYIDAKLSMMKLELDEERLQIGIVRTNLYGTNDTYNDEDLKLVDFMIIEILNEIGNEFFNSYFFKWSSGVYVMVFSPDNNEDVKADKEKIISMGQIMIEMLKKYVNIELAISFSNIHSDYLSLPMAFSEAQRAMDGLFYQGFDSILFYNDMKEIEASEDHLAVLSIKDDVPKAIEICDIEAIEGIFNNLMDDIRTKRVLKDEIYHACNHIFCLCDVFLGERWNEYNESIKAGPVNVDAVLDMQTLGEVLAWIENYKNNIVNFLTKENIDEKHLLVSRARKYIVENYMGTTGLKDVANYLNISPGYLSSIFTKYTGMCFTDYVNKIKIGEAQKLLKDGKHKIYEVSYMLGYENACYFSKIFKKIAGCSPTEFVKIAVNE